jgi:hypothetical protein
MEFNLKERTIPVIIKELRELRQLISLENYKFIEDGNAKERLEEVKVQLEDMSDFVENKLKKISAPKKNIWMWILSPSSIIIYLFSIAIHKIEKKMLKNEEKDLIIKKEKWESKKEEMEIKKEK